MIDFFRLEPVSDTVAASYDAIISIKKTEGASDIPGLRTMRGDKPEVVLTKSGTKWADCLTSAFCHFPLIFSSRIIESIQKHILTGLDWIEVEFDFKKCKKLAKLDHGKYFQVIPIGKPLHFIYRIYERKGKNLEFRFETDDKKNDPRCKSFFLPEGFIPETQLIPIRDSWSGFDFMCIDERPYSMLSSGGFYCSRRVVEIAREEGWTDFNFNPIDIIGGRYDDFLKRPWPPELWYPEGHPPAGESKLRIT